MLDLLESFEEPMYFFAAALVASSIAAMFFRREGRADAERLGWIRHFLVAGCALWLMLSPVAPLAGFAGAMLVSSVSARKSNDAAASVLGRGRVILGGV
jgi:hypothetical protein